LQTRQHNYLESSASLVENDLLRGGRRTLPIPDELLRKWSPEACYAVCCSRAWRPGTRDLYKWSLRDRIPAFRIPLRPTDKDVVIDLRPLIDRCYEVGRYYVERFDANPDPLFSPEDAAWADRLLRTAGLRGG
jgi:hypothetical protein